MSLKTVLPGECAGPIPNNSHKPVLSTLAVTSGCSKIHFISEPKIILLLTRV